MAGLLQDLVRLGREWGAVRVDLWRAQAQAAVEREQRRVFDTLALLAIGLLLSTMGLAGLLLLLWTELPTTWRLPVVGLLLIGLGAAGAASLMGARRRLMDHRATPAQP